MENQENQLTEIKSVPPRTIPLEIEPTLFFLWFSGLSYNDISRQYANTETSFTASQLTTLSRKHGWAQRKKNIIESLQKDFDDIIQHSRAKKMTAVAMAVDTVSEMIIKDVTDFRSNPKMFWDQVYTKQRPRPFWMAKSVDDLVNLFKLQSYLEGNKSDDDDGSDTGFNAEQKSKLLHTLAELRSSSDTKAELVDGAVDAEITVEKTDGDK